MLVAAGAKWIEGRHPLAIGIAEAGKAGFGVEDIPPIARPFEEHLGEVIPSEDTSQLSHRPIVEGIFEGVREPAAIGGDVAMFEVRLEVAIAGVAAGDGASRGGLHFDDGLEGLGGIEVPNAHLIGAHDQGDFMFGDHDRDVFEAGGAFGEPAAGVVERQLGSDPAAGPFRRDEVPHLVEIPERVPERVASQHHRVGIV